MVPEVRIPAPLVEVITPRCAPHLAPIAAEIEASMRRELEALPPETLARLLKAGAEIAADREAFKRFRFRSTTLLTPT